MQRNFALDIWTRSSTTQRAWGRDRAVFMFVVHCQQFLIIILGYSFFASLSDFFYFVSLVFPFGASGKYKLISAFRVPAQSVGTFMQSAHFRSVEERTSSFYNFLVPLVVFWFNAG